MKLMDKLMHDKAPLFLGVLIIIIVIAGVMYIFPDCQMNKGKWVFVKDTEKVVDAEASAPADCAVPREVEERLEKCEQIEQELEQCELQYDECVEYFKRIPARCFEF